MSDHTFVDIVQGKHGRFLINRFDRYVGKSLSAYGQFSEGEVRLFEGIVQRGHTVIEVGANIGALSVPLAALVGRTGMVHCFEPQTVVRWLLESNMVLNGHDHCAVYPEAVGNTIDIVRVPRLDPRQPNNFGGVEVQGHGDAAPAGLGMDDVRQLTLDAMWSAGTFGPRVHLIKLDCEGAELRVIEGATQLLAAQQPTLYVESDRPNIRAGLFAALQAAGYVGFHHQPRLYEWNNWAMNANNYFGEIVSMNVLCVPAAKAGTVRGLPQAFGAAAVADPLGLLR